MTKYLVLRKPKQAANTAGAAGFKGWGEVARVDAASADAAIRDVAERASGVTGESEYVAVPDRSWKPRAASVEQTTRVKLS